MARITLATTIDAQPADIVKALDSAEGIAGFWTEDVAYDGVGGNLVAGFADAPAPFRFHVAEASSNKVRWTNIGEYPPFFVDTEVTWSVAPAPDGSGTMVHFTHDGWASDDMPMPAIAYVWAQVLESLKSYVETGKGSPLHTVA
ncbi:MAG: SRPBCC family protein [bacterium]